MKDGQFSVERLRTLDMDIIACKIVGSGLISKRLNKRVVLVRELGNLVAYYYISSTILIMHLSILVM